MSRVEKNKSFVELLVCQTCFRDQQCRIIASCNTKRDGGATGSNGNEVQSGFRENIYDPAIDAVYL